ncbi:hypothetical protein BJ742DRAFT_874183 [Cladochytrium replicatum]|nr:hypothetical protein BJ742DRAFT_874183 [Cladochytrium replicatum]
MLGRKETVGEQLADLANAAPSTSFLKNFEAPPRLAEEDSLDGEEEDAPAPVSGRMLIFLQAEPVAGNNADRAIRVDEEKYRGRRVSRVALQDGDEANGVEINDDGPGWSDNEDDGVMGSASEDEDDQKDSGSDDEDEDISDNLEQDGDVQDQLEQQGKQDQILLKQAHTTSLTDAENGPHFRFGLVSTAIDSLGIANLWKKLHHAILVQNRKRSREDVDEIWTQLDDLGVRYESFRWSTIDKWSIKGGQGASVGAGDKKFKAVEVEVSEQIRRKDEGVDQVVVGGSVDTRLAHYDNEIFDDTDFYEQLLKEYIDSRITDTGTAPANTEAAEEARSGSRHEGVEREKAQAVEGEGEADNQGSFTAAEPTSELWHGPRCCQSRGTDTRFSSSIHSYYKREKQMEGVLSIPLTLMKLIRAEKVQNDCGVNASSAEWEAPLYTRQTRREFGIAREGSHHPEIYIDWKLQMISASTLHAFNQLIPLCANW